MKKRDWSKRCPQILRVLFITFCVGVTFKLTLEQIKNYFDNEDSSKVLYKNFEDIAETESVYPMVSVCIVTFENKSLINEEKLFGTKHDTSDYQLAMLGDLDYQENKLPNDLSFENVTIHLKDYMDSFEIEDINNDVIDKWDHSTDHNGVFPLKKSYQDPQTMCFSWNSRNVSLSYVKVYFSKSKLIKTPSKDHEYYIYLYLTMNNQLIRNMLYLHKEDFWLISNKTYNHVRIDVTGISLLRLRKDANIPCDEKLANDDMNWMQHVMEEVGCVPLYWNFLELKTSTPLCNETNQYKKFTEYFARNERRRVYEVFDKYKAPCTRMRILSSIKFLEHYEKEKLKVDVRYLTREFEEIENVRDVDVETLTGDIGGVVGMILGVSIIQLAILLSFMVKTMIGSLKSKIKY